MLKKFDLLIRGARVYDGAGNPPVFADIGVERDRITMIGSLDARNATIELDGNGLSVAPGFIDAHTHDDFAALCHDMSFKSRGGVTTCIVGNCGFGAAPYAEALEMLGSLTPGVEIPPYTGYQGYAAALRAQPPGVNIGVLAGHGTLRLAAMGRDKRAPRSAEMQSMKDALDEALHSGVLGLSSGLIYEPGKFAETEELVEIAAQMRGSGALYATHMRDEGAGLLDAVTEAIAIGARAGVPVQISHLKASGRENWGKVGAALRLIEAAQSRGENVNADQYPYTAGSTSLRAVLDNGAFSADSAGGFGRVEATDLVIASSPGHPEWEGRSIHDLCPGFNAAPRDTALSIVDLSPNTTCIIHMMSEEDVQHVMRHRAVMIGSDGLPTLDGKPHPRLYNSFARVIGHYARDRGLFALETAIHRMTGFSAKKFGLVERGRIREGAFADLVVFDADAIIDTGTYANPNRYPLGIKTVIINGVVAIDNDRVLDVRAGRVLSRAARG